MALYVQETFLNKDRGYRFGESEPYEAWTDDAGKLYRDLVKEYGRCTGKVYIDRRTATNDHGGERWDTVAVGWVFEKRMKYEDDDETYLREVWVTLHDAEPVKTIEYRYHELA